MANPFADLPDEAFQPAPVEQPQAAPPPATPQAAPPQEGGTDLGPFSMTVGALRDAAQGVINLGTDATNAILDVRPGGVGDMLFGRQAGPLPPTLGESLGIRARALDLPQIARSDHEWVNAGRSVLKYVAGAAGGMAALRSVGAASGAVGDLLGGFIGDFTVADKADGNLSNLLEEVPALRGPVTEALSVDPDDSNWEVRLKTGVEGFVVGAALSGLVRTVGILRGARREEALKGTDAARTYLDAHADELADAAEELRKAPEQLELFPDVVRREENLRDIDLLIRGDRYVDPTTGNEVPMKLSERARAELEGLSGPNRSMGELSDETRREVLEAFRKGDLRTPDGFTPNAARIVRPKPFRLNDATRTRLGEELRKSIDAGPMVDDLADHVGDAVPELRTAFNYAYMDTPESVKLVLDDFAKVLQPQMAKVGGGVQSFKNIQGLADVLSMKPDVLMAGMANVARHGEAMAAYAVAGKMWMQSLARDIRTIARSIDSGVATGTAEIELMRRVSVMEDLAVNLKGVQTAAARTTAAGRIRTSADLSEMEITSLLDGMDRSEVRFIAKKLAMAESPKETLNIVQGSRINRVWGIANEVFINGLLSGIKTHVINMTTAAMNTLLLPSYRIVGATLTGDLETAREGLYFLRALRGQIGDALSFSRKAFNTESSIIDTAYRQVEANHHAITAANFSLSEGDPLGFAIKSLGSIVRMPSRFLTAEDEFWKQLSYRASVTAKATREAYEKGLSDTQMVDYFVDGRLSRLSQVDSYVMDRMQRAFNPDYGFAVDERALSDARKITFTQPLRTDTWLGNKSFSERVQEMAAGHPFIRHTVLPFVRVPANLMREATYLTPLAPLRKQFWSDIQAGGTQRADALGRLTIGSMFATLGTYLAAEGTITGSGPADPELQRVMKQEQAGWAPYSIKIGDRYVSYQRLDPFATILGVIADASYVFGKHEDGVNDELAAGITLAIANAINSKGYLKGLTDLMATLGAGSDKEGRVEAILRQRAGAYVPSIARDMTGDPEIKRVRTVLDALMARTPGMSTSVEAHRDNFGNKMVAPTGFPWSAINPFAMVPRESSPAYAELREWAMSPIQARFPMPHYKYGGQIDLTQVRNANTGQSAYDRWMELHSEPIIGGRNLEEAITHLIESGGYRSLKERAGADPIYRNHPALELLRTTMEQYRDVAFQRMLREPGFEDLAGAVQAYDINRRVVPFSPDRRRTDPTLEQLLRR